jgi:hypothetical protein
MLLDIIFLCAVRLRVIARLWLNGFPQMLAYSRSGLNSSFHRVEEHGLVFYRCLRNILIGQQVNVRSGIMAVK